MGTITGQAILDRAWVKAKDEGVTKRWPSTEGLYWLNDGQRAIAEALPVAYTLTARPTASAGCRQTMAALGLTSGVMVVDVTRNMAADGVTPGRSITKRDRTWLDEGRPNWNGDAPIQNAYHWMPDERDPKAFFLYPAKTSGRIEVVYAATPADLISTAYPIALDDNYANALQSFVLFSFFSKDAEHQKAATLATMYFGMFRQALGLRDTALNINAQKTDNKVTPAP